METAVAAARWHASSGLTSLSQRLTKQFTASHGDAARNLVFSPLSIYSALSLVAAGAQGKTLRELLDLLGTGSRDGLDANVRAMVEQAIPAPAASHQEGGPRVSYARDGLQGLMDAMASSPSFLQDNLPLNKVEVGEFWVPRFKMSYTRSLSEDLHDLGVQAVFSGAAELPDLLEEDDESHEPLFLGNVLHKAVIEVNEEGTEAAAVTASDMFTSCGLGWQDPPPVDFVADHPFAFFVVEEVSGAILFAGQVLDPTRS
jgi:serpin B